MSRASRQRGSAPGTSRLFSSAIPVMLLAGMSVVWWGWSSSARPASASRGAALLDETIYGPQQFNGSSGQGQTYVERFTTTPAAGRLYMLHLVNGAPDGTQRASKVIVKLNGFEVVSQNEVTQSVAQLDRPVAITAVDTIRVTVAGSGIRLSPCRS